MRRFRTTRIADVLVAPFVYPSAWLLRNIRFYGIQNFPLSRHALEQVGVFPIRNAYDEPQFDFKSAKTRPLERKLPGIDWNAEEQCNLLKTFTFSRELEGTPIQKPESLEFYFDNAAFGPGDAEFLYQLIRLKKPKRIIEIGSGHSTLMAIKAIRANRAEQPGYACEHVCIEPYLAPYLESAGVEVIRRQVQELEPSFFERLEADDLLFIDSSHVIRPDGDVLFEYLQLLPTLKRGVIVHIHDVFSPRDYPDQWVCDWVRFWNEQYVLEAFLTHNRDWKIIGALNYLHHNHTEAFRAVAPFMTPDREPASFYIQKIA